MHADRGTQTCLYCRGPVRDVDDSHLGRCLHCSTYFPKIGLDSGGKRLNLGCGREILDGFVNVDSVALPGVDVVWDLTLRPWPFKENTFDYVLARSILEHVPHTIQGERRDGLLLVMEEVHRILKPGGHLQVMVPHFRSDEAYLDPTHQRFFTPEWYTFFDPHHPRRSKSGAYYTPVTFALCREWVGWRLGPQMAGLAVNDYHLSKHLHPLLGRVYRRLVGRRGEVHTLLECRKD